MIQRKPVAPNNRNGRMRKAFLQSLESQATPIKFPKANESPSIVIWNQAGRQTAEGFGGGNRVMKR